jgi:opacity protein-like surface antigen
VGGPRANVSALTEPEFAGDKKAKREIKRLHNVIDKAQDGLLDVVPTTIAGVAALLDYAAEHAPQGNGWGGGSLLDDGAPRGWEKEHGVTWEVVLHKKLAAALPTISSSQTMTGFGGGGQLGANFQYRHTVFGFEVDADASSQKTSSNTLTATMSSFATARARIGYAYDRIHYYVTGGGGYVQFSSSGTTTSSTGAPVTTTGTSRRTAWVAGAGSKSAVTPNVILRFEFLYLQLLENTQNSASATPATSSKRVYNMIGRVGLSYKWWIISSAHSRPFCSSWKIGFCRFGMADLSSLSSADEEIVLRALSAAEAR